MIRRALLLAAVLATACGPSPAPPPPPASEFVIGAPYDLTSLDPHLANTVSNYSVLSNVYEPLVTTDADLRVRPCLAESWENTDRLTLVMHLRRDVRFHSGRPLRAADVVWSLQRLLTDPTLQMGGFLQTISSVDAVDEHTVRLHTARATHVLLNKLHFALVVPEGSTGVTLDARADGTGPFRVTTWRRGHDLLLARNDAYWGTPARLPQVRFVFASPPDVAEGVRIGRFQLAQGGAAVEQAAQARAPRYDVIVHDNIYVKYLGLDVGREITPFVPGRPNPFRNPEVRQAVSLAIDRAALAAALPAHASPASQPVPRFIFGFNPALPVPAADPQGARALLRHAGVPDGFAATLHARSLFEGAARLVAGQLGRVGIRLEVQVEPDGRFFDEEDRREHSAWVSRYGCPTGDASDALENLYHTGDLSRRIGEQNASFYSNRAVDRAIEDSLDIDNPEDRLRAMQDTIALVTKDLPLIPLYTDQDVYALDRGYRWQPRNDSYLRAAEIQPR